MSIADKLTQLITTKANIKQAIIDKGVDLTGVPFTAYPNKILEIEGGGSGEEPLPTDGKTHIYVDVTPKNATTKQVTLNLSKFNETELTVDWGDGKPVYVFAVGSVKTSVGHTYDEYGTYEITLWNSNGAGKYDLHGLDGTNTIIRMVGGTNTTTSQMPIKCIVGENVGGGPYFADCKTLEEVIFLYNLGYISGFRFNGCYSLKKVILPNQLPSIGSSAFRYCYSLSEITIPSSVTSIGTYVFDDCRSLKRMIIEATTPPTLASTAISSPLPIFKIFVPNDSVNAYKTASNWLTYADYIYPISEMESD